jgi:hypothetical protein
MRLSLIFFAFVGLLGCQSLHVCADVITLYDGTGRPSQQSWLTYFALPLGSATETILGTGVRLETNAETRAGYSNYLPVLPPATPSLKNNSFPTLNRTDGFALQFQVAIDSESHLNDNRAGFSVILLGSDQRGIELGFWTDRIWAQETDFVQSEGVALDTTQLRTYELRVLGEQYDLREDGISRLTGAVRNYSGFGVPYNLSNYLFLGDNTTSAGANARFGAIVLQPNLSSVPEPTSAFLVAVVVGWMARRRPYRVKA